MTTDTLNPVAQQYPEVQAHIEKIPPHIADHVGELVMQLAHEDMYAKTEVIPERGDPFYNTDFEQLVTEPGYDSSLLSAEAQEAAKRGQEELAGLFTDAARLISSSHAELSEAGAVFGSDVLETEEQLETREKAERDLVYETAYNAALGEAVAAKEAGDEASAVKSLESLILLRYVHSTNDRQILRDVVKAGLGKQLLPAAQMSKKLYRGSLYDSVGGSLLEAKQLIEMSSGRRLDFGLKDQGELTTFSQASVNPEALKDLTAVLVSPDPPFTLENAKESFSGNGTMDSMFALLQPGAPKGEKGSIEYVDELFSYSAEHDDINSALDTTRPRDVLKLAHEIGVSAGTVVSVLGRRPDVIRPYVVEDDDLLALSEIHAAYPDRFAQLLEGYYKNDMRVQNGFEPRKFKAGLDVIAELGADDDELFELLSTQTRMTEIVANSRYLIEYSVNQGSNIQEVLRQMSKSDVSLFDMIEAAKTYPPKLEGMIGEILTQGELYDEYVDVIEKLEPPYDKRIDTLSPSALPHITERLIAKGLPSEVVDSMVSTWLSYSAFTKFYFKEDHFEFPSGPLPSGDVSEIARDQVLAIRSQLKAFESFADTYGMETVQGVISTFGIFNFKRYDPAKLREQLWRWEAGEPIKSVVVEARHDWNTFTGDKVKFAEEVGDGVYSFEAGSPAACARVAVQAGKHERDAGREPSVDRFIIRAHGNPDGMLLSDTPEGFLKTANYTEAARKREKIGSREANNFRRHLGSGFEIILESCSVAGYNVGRMNIAQRIKETHDAKTTGSKISVGGLTIAADGSVTYNKDGATVVYE